LPFTHTPDPRARFRALGVNNGDAVGIFMAKTAEYSIAYAAALKAGGAYTILDV